MSSTKTPTEIKSSGLFDKVAASTASTVARAPFFAFCVLLIVVWAPTIVFTTLDTWQLIINTITTIITFLLVALLQNTTDRAQQATAHKLDAALKALTYLLEHDDDENTEELEAELKKITGVELEASR